VTGLTPKEQENVLVALRFIRVRAGGWKPLAKALGFASSTMINVKKGNKGVSASMAFRVARLVVVPMEDLLAGKFPEPGTCAHCGR
jgi:DNA-binding XRE family transcriptional regulator